MGIVEQVLRFLSETVGARPVGSPNNLEALRYLSALAKRWGFTVHELPFECLSWEHRASFIRVGPDTIPVYPGPYSPPLSGSYRIARASSVEALRDCEFCGGLLVIHGALAEEPLMPTDFPFYFPDEHREIIELIHAGAPAGILALTGKHPLCGLSPFPLFEDGALGIANAFASAEHLASFFAAELRNESVEIEIASRTAPARGTQAVFRKPGEAEVLSDCDPEGQDRRMLVCAHMDTKYDTPGALDNAAGVAVMMAVMQRLQADASLTAVEFVPFNGEEYFGVSGQLAYLECLRADRRRGVTAADRHLDLPDAPEEPTSPVELVLNIDGVGLRGSGTALSSHNSPKLDLCGLPGSGAQIAHGEPWVAGDHSIFAFRGIPCLALTSSTIMTDGITLTHTPADTVEKIDFELLEVTADAAAELVRRFLRRS